MKPKISVIVIGYNIQNYIENCIQSILSQSYKEYEVVFVNDGSKDNTLEIASKYKDKIRIVNKSNGGIVSARKAGLKVAIGEYITFVDGDDWVNVDFLKNLFSPIELNDNIDIVCSNFFYQDFNGTFRKETCNQLSIDSCNKYEFFDGIMMENIDHHMFPKLYKKEFILNAGYLDYPEVTMAEDWITNAFFGLYKPNVFFSTTTNYFYRFNVESVSRKGGEKILEQIKTFNYMEKYFAEKREYDYISQMNFLWFAYTRTYLLENTESDVKKKIVYAFRKKKIDYKKNKYCVESIKKLGKKAKIKLYFEINFPVLIPLFDITYNTIKEFKDKYTKSKNAKYEKSLEQLYDSYIEKIKREKNNYKIYLIGTSDRSNVGDHAIALSELRLIKQIFNNYSIMEITGDTFRNRRQDIKNIICKEDIIFITGGGFLGDLWPDEEYMVNAVLEDYSENKIIVLPQTIYFYDEVDSPLLRKKLENYTKHKSLYLTARDKKTFEFYERYFEKSKIGLFPDMALYLDEEIKENSNNEVLICIRDDKERVISKDDEMYILSVLKAKGLRAFYGSTLTDGIHNGDIKLCDRGSAIKSKLVEFSKARFIITDRLHGMILATIAGTPCIVFDNLSKKVSGVYELWLKDLETILFCYNKDEIENLINKITKIEHFKYSAEYLNEEKEKFVNFIINAIGDK